MLSSLRAARWPLFAVGTLCAVLAGCGGGSNLPTPGSNNGSLGNNGDGTDNGGTDNSGTTLSSNAIVFVSTRDGNPEIYSMNVGGTGVKRLTTNDATDEQPSRSPDGSRVVFSSQRDGNSEIYIMNADGTNLQRLTSDSGPSADAPQDVRPVFSPDGTRIVWQSTRGNVRRLYTMLPTGGDQRAVTFAQQARPSFDGAWNPDSTRLLGVLINATSSNLNDIALITPGATASNAATFQILRAGTNGAHPRYSPDGSRIVYFNAPTLGDAKLQFLDGSGTPIAGAPTGGTNQSGPSFSPDSKRLVWDAWTDPSAGDRQIYLATIGSGTTPATGAPITTQGENYDASWTQ